MPMLSPQLASRAVPAQGPWEMFSRRDSTREPSREDVGSVTSSHATSEEDILLPLNKSRTASLGGIAPGSSVGPFRPFDSARPAASLFIHNLPRDMTQRELHLMFTFANDYMACELFREPGRTFATVKFRTMGGATAAQAVLEHRPDIFGDASNWLKCEIRPTSSAVSTPTTTQPPNIKSRFLFMNEEGSQGAGPTTPVSAPVSTGSIGGTSMASGPGIPGPVGPPVGPPVGSVGSIESFPASPLYTSASRLFDPLPLPRRPSNGNAFDDKQRPSPSRRASVPTRPLNELSIQTPPQGQTLAQQPQPHPQHHQHHQLHQQPQQLHQQPQQPHQHQQPHQPQQQAPQPQADYDGSKVVVPFGPGTSKAKAVSIMQSGGRVMPPANPADQNPPCNTLYVGNLPPDTQEEELKELFSSHPGYKRLCFRTKANGPMCFVEFEDEVLAGKALEDLYGFGLSNSVKGGIRLSYSKNPLGVRSRQPQQKYPN